MRLNSNIYGTDELRAVDMITFTPEYGRLTWLPFRDTCIIQGLE
jgi:hypothetical protein